MKAPHINQGIVFAANILLANRSLSAMLNEFPSRKVCQESLGLEKTKFLHHTSHKKMYYHKINNLSAA